VSDPEEIAPPGRLTALVVLLPIAFWTIPLATGAADWCLIDLVNLAFHEAGHLIFTPFGTTLHYLGGTLGQIAVPLLLGWYFLVRRPQPIGAAFCSWWAGENLVNISVYMADARALALPLVGGGDHDWNELFYRFGLLASDSVAAVAAGTRGLGVVCMTGGLLWVAWFVLPINRDFREPSRRSTSLPPGR